MLRSIRRINGTVCGAPVHVKFYKGESQEKTLLLWLEFFYEREF